MAQSELTIRENQVSEITLSYKPNLKPSQRPKIGCSNDAREVFLKVWDENKLEFVEEFKVVLMNRANRVIGIKGETRSVFCFPFTGFPNSQLNPE